MGIWEDLLGELITTVDGLSDNDLQTLAATFSYQGFNPETIANQLSRLQPNAAARSKDIYTMIILFLCRGNKFDKIIKKSSAEAAQSMRTILEKYRIKSAKPTTNSDLTLARISATFPYVTYKVIMQLKPQRPVDQWLSSHGIVGISPVLKMPGIFSLLSRKLSKTNENLNIIKSLLIIQHGESEVINAQKEAYRRDQIENKLYQLIQYARAAFLNMLTSEEHRSEVSREIRLAVSNTPSLAIEYSKVFGLTNDGLLKEEFCVSTD